MCRDLRREDWPASTVRATDPTGLPTRVCAGCWRRASGGAELPLPAVTWHIGYEERGTRHGVRRIGFLTAHAFAEHHARSMCGPKPRAALLQPFVRAAAPADPRCVACSRRVQQATEAGLVAAPTDLTGGAASCR